MKLLILLVILSVSSIVLADGGAPLPQCPPWVHQPNPYCIGGGH